MSTGRRRTEPGFYSNLAGVKRNTRGKMADGEKPTKVQEGECDTSSVVSKQSKQSKKGYNIKRSSGGSGKKVDQPTLNEFEEKIDRELAELETQDARSKFLHEKAKKGEIEFIEDWECPEKLENEDVFTEECTKHDKEKEVLSTRMTRLSRKRELMTLKANLRQQRWHLLEQEKHLEMEEWQNQWEQNQAWLELQRKEQVMQHKMAAQRQEMDEFHRQARLTGWIDKAAIQTSKGDVESVQTGKSVNSSRLKRADDRMKDRALQEKKGKQRQGDRVTQSRIQQDVNDTMRMNLRQEIRTTAPETGVSHIRRMGMLPDYGIPQDRTLPKQVNTGMDAQPTSMDDINQINHMGRMEPWDHLSVHDDQGKKKLKLGENQGKTDTNGDGKEKRIKSGKFAKSHVDLVREEIWPHVSVLRKYSKRVPFDQLDFEMFTAGETRIISAMMHKEPEKAAGRLKVLCKVAHWLCKCRDWPAVRNLFEAIIESVEMGEEEWMSGFEHYESMLPPPPSILEKIRKEGKDGGQEKDRAKDKDKKTPEVFWCKDYQKNMCTEASPHSAQLKPDEKPVQVVHMCATCWVKEKKRRDHPEADASCPNKKA